MDVSFSFYGNLRCGLLSYIDFTKKLKVWYLNYKFYIVII